MYKKIPAQCFFYWGQTPLPFFNYLTLVSFRALHPEWKMILLRPAVHTAQSGQWGTGEQGVPYKGEDYIEHAYNIVDDVELVNFEDFGFENTMADVHKADFLRQYVMYQYGGLWSDMDVLWIKSIEELACPDDVDVMLCWNAEARRPYFTTGIVMARPQTEYHRAIYEACPENYNPKEYQSLGPGLLRKIFPTVQAIHETGAGENIFNAPYSSFYPVNYKMLHELYTSKFIKELSLFTVAIHWFGGAELSRKQLKKVQPSCSRAYEGTLMGSVLQSIPWGRCRENLFKI